MVRTKNDAIEHVQRIRLREASAATGDDAGGAMSAEIEENEWTDDRLLHEMVWAAEAVFRNNLRIDGHSAGECLRSWIEGT